MEADTNSSNASVTSLEDKTEDFCENPTRDSLTEGLMYIIKSSTDQLDEKVAKLRLSQIELKDLIERLADDLKVIQESRDGDDVDLGLGMKKILATKRKVTLISSLLQGCEERLRQLDANVNRDCSKHRAVVETEKLNVEQPPVE